MKKFLLIWGVILVLVIFQTSLLAPWFSNQLYPDLVLVCTILAVVIFGFQGTWNWVIIAGITLDIFAYSKIGTHVIIFSLAAYVVSFVSRRFSIGGRGIGIILIILLMPVITAFDFWGAPFLNGIDLKNKILTSQSFYLIGLVALENSFIFFVFYPLFLKLKKKYSPAQFRMGK